MNFLIQIRLICVLLLYSFAFSCSNTISPVIEKLKVEGQSGYLVTNEQSPRMSWEINTGKLDKTISGYKVIASSKKAIAETGEGDLWESVILPVENGPWVLFDTSALASKSEVWWRVCPVYSDNSLGKWSDFGLFETGLKDEDWQGKWIGMNPENRKRSAPQLRKSFNIEKKIKKARLYVCGLGYHESWINGERIGNEVLQPAQTDYELRSFYISHDVTQYLQKGTNTLGVWLGDGFYNQDIAFVRNGLKYGEPRLLSQLEVYYKDGSSSTICTDDSWQCSVSAITGANIFAGENYDARINESNWSTTEKNNQHWEPVIELPAPGAKLIAQQLPPCRRKGRVQVKKVEELRPGTFIFDFGQNLVGWAKLKVEATPGTKITIRFAENRLGNGELGFASSGVRATKHIQTDTYICKGQGEEIWEPRFTYHGFRFAEVSITNGSLRTEISEDDFLEGVVIHTDMDIVGEFECSDPVLNKAFELAHWTQAGNIQGVPTDCPIRERCGWTGDAHLTVPYTMLRFNSAPLWRKYIDDIVTKASITGRMLCFGDELKERTVQIKKAGIPTMVAPGKRFIGEGSPDWGCAIAFIPWDIYIRTGDDRALKVHYNSIKQWVEHLKGLSVDGIIYSGMGDWCRPEYQAELSGRDLFGSVSPMLSTACYYRSVRILADAAKLFGRPEDFNRFDTLANEIREAFTTAFYSDQPIMKPDQTINAIAVNWNVLTPELHPKIAKTLAKQVRDADHHFTTGVFGMPSLWPVLGQHGFYKIIWKALQNNTAPSLKYLYKREATTFWEVWPMEKNENEEYDKSMSHPFQGSFVAWFFEGLAGINPDANNPGYKNILLQPQMVDGLNWVKCNYKSPMGNIKSSWQKTGNTFEWDVEVPIGAKAQVKVPGKIEAILLMDANRPEKTQTIMNSETDKQEVELLSGRYRITSKLE